MNAFIERLKTTAIENTRNIILPEAEDERVLKAAEYLLHEKICDVTLIGEPHVVESSGFDLRGAKIISPADEILLKELTEVYYELRKDKGLTWVEARRALSKPITLASVLLKQGQVDGLVSGSISPTADVLRSGIQVIKPIKGNKTVSSFFVMIEPSGTFGSNGILLFADCGVIPSPDSSQLADIALATAGNFKKLVKEDPRVAFLSFSTKGSARHADVDKVTKAFEIASEKNTEGYLMDAELQLDAALIESVASKKAPKSVVAGNANVLIFPDLNAGNIGYKLVQRLANAEAYGPIIQGLSKPMNDLSRGCTWRDIVNVCVITAVQAL